MKSITGKKFKKMLDSKEVKAIDLDPKNEFKNAHIQGAINISYSDKEFIEKFEKKFTKKTDRVVICAKKRLHSQVDRVASNLKKAGYTSIYAYVAGVSDWKTSGLKIQRQA